MVSYQDILDTEGVTLPQKTMIDALYDGTSGMSEFSCDVMLKLLRSLLGPTAKEIAVRDTYYRLDLYLRSLLALNKLEHFQSVASAARSIFELWVDIELLARDTTGEVLKKYNSFPELERYNKAKKLLRYLDAHPDVHHCGDVSIQRTYVANPEREARLLAIWGTDKRGRLNGPSHWSERDLRARAQEVGQESTYMEAQSLLSWFVHGGNAGTAGVTNVGFEAVYALSHLFTQRFFIAAATACGKVTKISELPEFSDWITHMRVQTAKIVVSEQLKILEEN
jgi:hypothetical protein